MTGVLEKPVPPAGHAADTRRTELRLQVAVPADPFAVRSGEPVSIGVPLPQGAWRMGQEVTVRDGRGTTPVQAQVLDAWPDGSARWVLLDFAADAPASYTVTFDPGTLSFPAASGGVRVRQAAAELTIATGNTTFRIPRTGTFRIEPTPGADVAASSLVLEVVGAEGQALDARVQESRFELSGSQRAVAFVAGTIGRARQAPLRFTARVHFFASSPVVRCELTVSNPAAAGHPDGCWQLGDSGSVFLRDVAVRLSAARESRGAFCQPESGAAAVAGPFTFELFQESSGGEHWQSPVHRNRKGEIPLRMRGYRMRAGGKDTTGLRATPVAWMDVDGGGRIALAMEHFWQNFPKSIECRGRDLVLRLFPQQSADLHEIQGGEQKTHVFHAAFGRDSVTADPLAWARQPALAAPGPDWYARAEAVPYLTTARSSDSTPAYEEIVTAALAGPDSFVAKRERIDEYGWRNFGDIYADHEAVFSKDPAPVVSHYNNQYDAVAGCAFQFMRTGDLRWFQGLQELARHVADIDIYHTDRDKSAYNGGLFWHTCHYRDAGLSSHRSYPRVEGIGGGGPSNEHAYSTGLMLHYLMTGSCESRNAAIGLADWILRMDDGRLSVFRWVTRHETGLASATGSPTYHGPGRGAGNAITLLLNGFRLTGDRKYLDKAEALIRRVIHPSDDLAERDLLNAELRWSYTVFLQALGRYLDDKIERNELDGSYAYARASLLHYARWMAGNEYPYLDNPQILEYPTETWAAQDMRKSEVFFFTARHAEAAERERFAERAEFFHAESLRQLRATNTWTLARPLVIMMTCGFRRAGFRDALGTAAPAPAAVADFGTPSTFVPQKQIARRRALGLAVTGVVGVGSLVTALLVALL
jgi:hypothetical protein